MKTKVTRRKFLGAAAFTLAGISIVPRHVLGGKGFVAPSDKLTIGVIGNGRQSHGLTSNFLKMDNNQIVAASDVYQAKLDAFEKFVADHYAQDAGKAKWSGIKKYPNYQDIIDRRDIDAVIVVVPDHWHALPSIQAANSGKHVYCEKPLAHTVKEGRAMVNAARKNNITFQTGSMQRSWEIFRHACELVVNGYIGDIKSVKVNVGDPSVPCDLPEETLPTGLNWGRWLGAAPMRPFNSILAPLPTDKAWPMWRKYREYGGGILSDWGAHMFDIAQWALGMDDSGPVELVPPKDPKATHGLVMRYANGIEMTHEDFGRGYAVEFDGTEGVLQVSRSFLETKPERIAKIEIKTSNKHLYYSDNHYLNWIECIKSGKKPICDVEVGQRSSTVCAIANIAYWMNEELKWDPAHEKFDNKKANQYLTREYRKGYKVPV